MNSEENMSSLNFNQRDIQQKEEVAFLKTLDEKEIANYLEQISHQVSSITSVLKSLGHLPKSFNYDIFVPYLKHQNEKVRYWAIKNIGKSKDLKYFLILREHFLNEKNTSVKRECVSAVGRMNCRDVIPFLVDTLKDSDPKIVAQAIRGLLVYKGEKQIDEILTPLIEHENEMVSAVISKEYSSKKTQSHIQKQPHSEVYDYLKNVVVNADVRDALKVLEDESIHLTFTSPPYYNARDYSIYPSYEAYLKFLEEVFLETYRITKEGRYLIVNTSPVIVPRISRAHSSKRYPIPFDLHSILIRMGWEFIDDIVWMKPEYSVKNRVGGFQQHRKPLAYKPNSVTEYLMVYRKKTEKLLDWNIRQYSYEVVQESKVHDDFETTNVWQICPKSDKIHSAVFPEELCKRVIEYYSYKGDVVFDPFAGSGTLGRTAKKLNRYFFLTEKDETYFEYMKTMRKADDSEYKTKFLNLDEFRRTKK